MRYLSVCSGIEAATVAWSPLGWEPIAFAEIAKFPAAVIRHHYPTVPNLGDVRQFERWPDAIVDLLVGGTPCQSFSIAGLRGGLADQRGNLALVFLRIASRFRPRWIVWENVAGCMSTDGGRDFGTFLGGLVELGYGFAYRVLDAQFVRVVGFDRAVPQRRRRVFVVGNPDWRRAAQVLFDASCMSWNSRPRRSTGQGIAADVAPSLTGSGRGVQRTGESRGQDPVIAHVPEVANPTTARMSKGINTTLDEGQTLIAFHGTQDPDISGAVAHPLGRNQGQDACIAAPSYVRRLMPIECERLMGLPDDYTLIPWRGRMAPDKPRYNAIGNSFPVNCIRWIGRRIQLVEEMTYAETCHA